MSKSNAPHVQKHPRFFWEFLEHFEFFDPDQAIARKNNYSETPKPPRLTQNWLSSTKLAITSEILGIFKPNIPLYFKNPPSHPLFWRSKLNRLILEQLTEWLTTRSLSWFMVLSDNSFHSFLLPPLFSLTNLVGVEMI